MPRKKILWLCSWYPDRVEPFSGDFVQRHAQAASIHNDIYVIHVAASPEPAIPPPARITARPGLIEDIRYVGKSKSYWGRLKAHFNLVSTYRKAIKQYIAEFGQPDLVHVHIPIWAGLAGLWVKKTYKVPMVVTEHWGIYNEIEKNNYLTKSLRFRKVTKNVFSKADDIISVSDFLGKGVQQYVINRNYQVIPNVVNTDFFHFIEKPQPGFRFIHVSNMVPLKNAEGIIKTFARLLGSFPEATLTMVGNTNQELPAFARTLSIPEGSIRFKGEIPYPEVAAEMQSSNCLVLFSNIENAPCVIGEALCCGLPVIATRTGGIPELVDKSNSILVTPGNEEQLLSAMETMIKNYSVFKRREIADAATLRFSYPVVGAALDYVYAEILEK